MYQIDNGFKLATKENNWDFLNRFFKKKGISISKEDFDPVIHCAPDSGYQLLKKVYTILTGKEVIDT